MSARWLLVICLSLTWSWAISVNSATAQSAPKLVRVTYPVTDLVVPVRYFAGQDVSKTLEKTLIKVITGTVASESWKSAGGVGTMEYFPTGMALVVHQSEEVHQQIAQLLADLRRVQEVQVSVEVRVVQVAPQTARQLRKDMEKQGQPVRAFAEPGKQQPVAEAKQFVCIDDQQLRALFATVQRDRSAHIMQSPKITVFNGQLARVEALPQADRKNVVDAFSDLVRAVSGTAPPQADQKPIVDGLRFEALPVVNPDGKRVRLSLNLELFATEKVKDSKQNLVHVTKAARTFVMPPGRTLVWDLGAVVTQLPTIQDFSFSDNTLWAMSNMVWAMASTQRVHRYALVTPRVIIAKEAEPPFVGAEEQSVPGPQR